jgi:hypothetical protein
MASDRHHALVIPLNEGYAVSCSCGWVGGSHDAPDPAEREARDHEENPAAIGRPKPPPTEAIDERLDRR